MLGASGNRHGMGGGETFGFGRLIGVYVSAMGIASGTVAYSSALSALLPGMCVKTGEHCWSRYFDLLVLLGTTVEFTVA